MGDEPSVERAGPAHGQPHHAEGLGPAGERHAGGIDGREDVLGGGPDLEVEVEVLALPDEPMHAWVSPTSVRWNRWRRRGWGSACPPELQRDDAGRRTARDRARPCAATMPLRRIPPKPGAGPRAAATGRGRRYKYATRAEWKTRARPGSRALAANSHVAEGITQGRGRLRDLVVVHRGRLEEGRQLRALHRPPTTRRDRRHRRRALAHLGGCDHCVQAPSSVVDEAVGDDEQLAHHVGAGLARAGRGRRRADVDVGSRMASIRPRPRAPRRSLRTEELVALDPEGDRVVLETGLEGATRFCSSQPSRS